jgi:hypothetical protein
MVKTKPAGICTWQMPTGFACTERTEPCGITSFSGGRDADREGDEGFYTTTHGKNYFQTTTRLVAQRRKSLKSPRSAWVRKAKNPGALAACTANLHPLIERAGT